MSSVIMCIMTPLDDPTSEFTFYLDWLDKIFTIVFILEMILKIIAFGAIFNGSASYFRKLENILGIFIIIFIFFKCKKNIDFIIVIFSSFTFFDSIK
jgi:hypothetical protein